MCVVRAKPHLPCPPHLACTWPHSPWCPGPPPGPDASAPPPSAQTQSTCRQGRGGEGAATQSTCRQGRGGEGRGQLLITFLLTYCLLLPATASYCQLLPVCLLLPACTAHYCRSASWPATARYCLHCSQGLNVIMPHPTSCPTPPNPVGLGLPHIMPHPTKPRRSRPPPHHATPHQTLWVYRPPPHHAPPHQTP